MKYRTLGSTGLEVSVIGIGTWQFGGEWGKQYEQSDANAVFDAARETGINLIDTAECYGDHLSESLIGSAIERDRERWIIGTKFGHHFDRNFRRTDEYAPEQVQRQLDESLKALRTDYVDLYLYHSWTDAGFYDDDVLAVLHQAKAAGKIRHIGNSIASESKEDKDTLKQIQASQARGIEVIQLVYNRLTRDAETNGAFEACQEQNLGVLARVPLASGFLSGKYTPESRFQKGADLRGSWRLERIREMSEAAQKIQYEEVPEGVPMARWALAWCLQHPAVTCVIPGCKSPDQLRENAAAADLEMVQV